MSLHFPSPQPANKDGTRSQYGTERIRATINTSREVKSPTPEPPSTNASCTNKCSSLRSPSIDLRSPLSHSQTCPISEPSLILVIGERQEHRKLKSPTPEQQELKSPTPSPPTRYTGVSSSNGQNQEIDDEDTKMSSSGSSSCTITASPKTRRAPRMSITWPVNCCAESEDQYALPDNPTSSQTKTTEEKTVLFCCADLKKHLRTSPIMIKRLEEIHGPVINAFVANIGPKLEEVTTLPPQEFNAINRIIKVNRVKHGEEISTHLFTINKKESTFTKLIDSPRLLVFNPWGYGSYQSYCCPKHREMYRVGVYDKKFWVLKDRWSFGDIGLDIAMGLISQAQLEEEHFQAMMRVH